MVKICQQILTTSNINSGISETLSTSSIAVVVWKNIEKYVLLIIMLCNIFLPIYVVVKKYEQIWINIWKYNCRTMVKEKKSSYSSHINTLLWNGGFELQSRRFFVLAKLWWLAWGRGYTVVNGRLVCYVLFKIS